VVTGELPKVLYCSFDVIPAPTGSSARAVGFIRALEGRAAVDGLTLKTPELAHIERLHGMRLLRVPVGPGDLPARAQAFERAVRRQLEGDEYQLVHFTDPFGGYPLCELKRQYKYKVVYEVIGFPSVEVPSTHPHLEGDRRFMARLRRQELFCLMNADAVVVGSEQTARMVQGLGVSREHITVVPTQVDPAPYAQVPLPAPDREPMRVLYLGGQQAWQGLGTLVFAASIAAKNAQLSLTIAGPENPAVRSQLEEAVRHRRLTGLVEFLAPVPPEELPKLLGDFDLGAAPLEKGERNTVQGAPIAKIAHYLAAGRPIVAADLPAVRELCDERCAAFYKPGEEADLARRLVELAHDPARRVAMGARARALAAERAGAERGPARLLKLIAGLLGEVGEAFRGQPSPVGAEASIDAQNALEDFGPGEAKAPGGPRRSADPERGRATAPAGEVSTRQALVQDRAASPALGSPRGAQPIEVSSEDLEPMPAVARRPRAAPVNPEAPLALSAPASLPPQAVGPSALPEPVAAAVPQGSSRPIPPAPPAPSAQPAARATAQEPSAVAAPTQPGSTTPPSGLPPADEWAGHLVLGYAPFGIRMPHKGGNAVHWVGQAKARTPDEGVGGAPKNGRDR
jgi:glycosyltransferase involved in cell wall biosynthesis